MDYRTSAVLDTVLRAVQEAGPHVDIGRPDAEVISLSGRFKLPVQAVAVVKYLAEQGPLYDEMEDNAWNRTFGNEVGNDPDEPSDDTICPYDTCSGYVSEALSHDLTCPYILAIDLLGHWRTT